MVLTECEIARQARRVLRKLLGGGRLVTDSQGRSVLVARGRGGKPVRTRLPAAVVAAMVQRGWVAAADGRFTVTEAGKMLLARAGASPFFAQHHVLRTRLVRDPDGRELYVTVDEAESPLSWMRQRGLITAPQFEAGERLRRDYTLARMAPRLAADLTAPVVAGRRAPVGTLLPDTVLAAKQRFSQAMRAAGPSFSGILFDVCCDLRGLEDCERMRAWPRGAAKVVVKLGLDRLGEHYGGRRHTRRRLRVWRARDDGVSQV